MKEALETITVFRDDKGDIAGLITEERYHDGATAFTAYERNSGGYHWFAQSGNEQAVRCEARLRFGLITEEEYEALTSQVTDTK